VATRWRRSKLLAGGEFPVPIIQGSGTAANVTIIFKEFGVRLTFKPTIVDEDHIRLDLVPEVSTIDFGNGIKFGGFDVPALRTRRARTSIELKNTQSFALAGLLDATDTKSLSKVPLLGDIPLIGYLFQSQSLQKLETELIFIITVNLVKPVDKSGLPAMPGLDGIHNDKTPLTKTPSRYPDKDSKDDKDDKDKDSKDGKSGASKDANDADNGSKPKNGSEVDNKARIRVQDQANSDQVNKDQDLKGKDVKSQETKSQDVKNPDDKVKDNTNKDKGAVVSESTKPAEKP
jgi:Flp pilus assembly secretin CpaC